MSDSEFKNYLVLRPIAMGGRVEAGTKVQMRPVEAAAFAEGYLQLIVEPTAKVEESAETQTDGSGAGSQTDSEAEGSSTGGAGDQKEPVVPAPAATDTTVPTTVDHVVTQADLDADANLAATGVTVGQTIQVPAPAATV